MREGRVKDSYVTEVTERSPVAMVTVSRETGSKQQGLISDLDAFTYLVTCSLYKK